MYTGIVSEFDSKQVYVSFSPYSGDIIIQIFEYGKLSQQKQFSL